MEINLVSPFPSIYSKKSSSNYECEMDFLEMELRRYDWTIIRNIDNLNLLIESPSKQDTNIVKQYLKIYGLKKEVEILNNIQMDQNLKNISIKLYF